MLFKSHGTTSTKVISAGAALDLGSALLRAMPRDISPEAAQYWRNHTSELQRTIREVMLRPGARVVEIDRTKGLPFEKDWKDAILIRHDPRSKALKDISLSDILVLDFKKDYGKIFGPNPEYVPLDDHALAIFLDRPELIPSRWKRYDYIAFIGAVYDFPRVDLDPPGVRFVSTLERSRRQPGEWERTLHNFTEENGVPVSVDYCEWVAVVPNK